MTVRGAGRAVPVTVVLPARTLLLDVSGPLEVLRRANMVQDAVRFDVSYVAASRSIVSSIGLTLSGMRRLPASLPDRSLVVVSGNVDRVMGSGATGAPGQAGDEAPIAAWLRGVIRPDHTLITICSGALIAARAGLLDGYACTTHYECVQELAAIAPRARVLENRLYVEDRNRLTSAGITSGIDLMLHVVSRLVGHRCALAVARYLVVYLRRGGNDPQLSPWLDGRNHLHPVVHRVQDLMAAEPAKEWTVRALARDAGTSARHLTRLFAAHTGMSVIDYRNRLRLAVAREFIRETQLDMEHVAERAGFGSARQLRRAWRRIHADPPSELRRHA